MREAGQQASGGAAGLGMTAGGGTASGESPSDGASGRTVSTSGQGTGGAGEGGAAGSPADCKQAIDQQCLYDRQMRLGLPTVSDDDGDGDGLIEPGETIVIHSELQNLGPDAHNLYPGVAFTVSHPAVRPASGGWHDLFAVFAGDSQPFELSFKLPFGVAAGTIIAITLVPSGLNAHSACTCQHPLVIELVIEGER